MRFIYYSLVACLSLSLAEHAIAQNQPISQVPLNAADAPIAASTDNASSGATPLTGIPSSVEVTSVAKPPSPGARQDFLNTLDWFEKKYGRELDSGFDDTFKGYFDRYHDSTMNEAKSILLNPDVQPEERMYELDLFLRSKQGEWTVGNVGAFVGGKGADSLRDVGVNALLVYCAPQFVVPYKFLCAINNHVYSFIPGFSKASAQDFAAACKTGVDTAYYKEMRDYLVSIRGLSLDELKAKIQKIDQVKEDFKEDASEIPDRMRQKIMNECPDSLVTLSGQSRDILWEYMSGRTPAWLTIQIENRLNGVPQFDGWRQRAQQIYRESWAELQKSVLEQTILEHMRQATELRISTLMPPDLSLVIVIDASGSMKGSKLANAKKSATAQVAQLDKKTEVALIAFYDCNSIVLEQAFMPMSDIGKARIREAISGINASGSTPLADATAFANRYMSANARGKSCWVMILSDGDESCRGKDAPTAEAANFN